ncbi:choice-of-anchor I family protein [Nocardioides sp. CFH 31398]|uniref:choice-of-anchor I family protein n=1 Tax=Nocardioides sp. CFH 31398 TaxID=2919579 RepID=UPI001F068309|nr:choice-of-anchor I family protein [Nocardioides sp. CFH 31398]MCH1868515.1 choice-of-anchor I family protein [Nocardioides sp. CFH 31398]
MLPRRHRRRPASYAVPLALAALGTPLLASLPTASGAGSAVPDPVVLSADDAALSVEPLGTYRTGVFDQSAAEIVHFHAATQRLFVVNALSGALDVLDASDPADPTKETSLLASDVPGLPDDGVTANSVAVREDGLLAVALEAPVKTDPGWIAFADAESLDWLGYVQVGALPDMVTITDDGERAVVANEGEPADDYSVDPEGSVAVVELPTGLTAPVQDDVRTADFHAFEQGGSRPLPSGVRVFGPEVGEGFRVSRNLEPEYVTTDGPTAYVALQENNAVAVVDLDGAEVTDLLPLEPVDHSAEGHGLDTSDRDGEVAIEPRPVQGLPMPDGIESYTAGGTTYLVTANEGDAREWGDYAEPERAGDLTVCADSPAAGLLGDTELGRLNVTTASGYDEAGACYAELYSFGSRSFSVWTTDGERVFDSADAFEQLTAEAVPDFFNSAHDTTTFDTRSDDKGPEPENLDVGRVGGRTYAFVGLERIGGLMVFDVTDPADSAFVTYVNNRDFSVSVGDAEDPEAVLDQAGDLGPEGVEFIGAADSPTGAPLVAVGNEVSGTTTIFGVDRLTRGEAELTVRGLPDAVRYGRDLRPRVRVSEAGADATDVSGTVRVRRAGTLVATAPVVDGVARPELDGTRLGTGEQRLTFVFVPDTDSDVDGARVVEELTVRPARTATTVEWRRTPSPDRGGVAVVTVRNTDTGVAPTGTVAVTVDGRTRRVRLEDGTARVETPVAPRDARARATYAGSRRFGASSGLTPR